MLEKCKYDASCAEMYDDRANLVKTLDEIFNLILKVKKDGVSKKDYKRAISFLCSQILINFGSSGQISDEFLGNLLYKEDILMPEEKVKIIKSITHEDILNFRSTAFDLKNCSLALMCDQDLINSNEVESVYKKYTN